MGPQMLRGVEAPVPNLLFAGVIGAQVGLLAIWAVFGPQRWSLRLPVTLTYVGLVYTMVAMGVIAVAPSAIEWQEAVDDFLSLPAFFLSVQFPLWLLRAATGWRVVRADKRDEPSPTGSRQFHLRDLFVATTLVAVACGLAGVELSSEAEAAPWWIPGAVLLAASALSTLPCLWATLVDRRRRIGTAVVTVYTLLLIGAVGTIVSVIPGAGPRNDVLLASASFFGSLMAVMLGVLHVVRRCGYIIRRVGRREATPG